jgi:hypothetical protein
MAGTREESDFHSLLTLGLDELYTVSEMRIMSSGLIEW